MAGGVGSRFWPLSTPEYPKQFIDILGCGRSLIQMTADRFAGICPSENFWVVTNTSYVDIVREQLPSIPENHILAEPAARNTAPCIAWACWMIKEVDPYANVVVSPSDAVVMNQEEFRRVIGNAIKFTSKHEAIVTIGIQPSRPETGYGYIEYSEPIEGEINSVSAFKEKPDRTTAKAYITNGRYLWNTGIFVWNIATIVRAIRRHKPNIALNMDRILRTGDIIGIFPHCEKISIDFAVMEPAAAEGLVYTHPAEFGWSDLGNGASLHEKLSKDGDGNSAVGKVRFFECSNCIVHVNDAKKVSIQGLDGYIVSEKNGQILICRRDEEQRIRDFGES